MNFIAGLFLGTTLILIYAVVRLHRELSLCDKERKRWINKNQTKDGHTQVFPDAEVEVAERTPSAVKAPLKFLSPFRQQKSELKETLYTQKKVENGSELPEDIKAQLKEKMEAVK